MWEEKPNLPHVASRFSNLCQLMMEMEDNIADQVNVDLLLCMYLSLLWGAQVLTFILMVFAIALQEEQRSTSIIVQARR